MNKNAPWQIPEPLAEDVDLVRSQVYDARQPGPLIGSVEALLSFLEENQVPAAGRLAQFPIAHLPAMNACLPELWPIAMKRPRMRSYPNLEALWLILRIAGLIEVVGKGKNQVFTVAHEAVETWRAIDDQGRYAVLLECWLLRGGPELLEGYTRRFPVTPLQIWRKVASWAHHRRYDSKSPQEIQRMTRGIGLLSLFGFLTLRFGQPDKQGGWHIVDVHPTGFGDALLRILTTCFRVDSELETSLPHLDEDSLRPVLAAVFPRWVTD